MMAMVGFLPAACAGICFTIFTSTVATLNSICVKRVLQQQQITKNGSSFSSIRYSGLSLEYHTDHR